LGSNERSKKQIIYMKSTATDFC